jgi:hypothetical protein
MNNFGFNIFILNFSGSIKTSKLMKNFVHFSCARVLKDNTSNRYSVFVGGGKAELIPYTIPNITDFVEILDEGSDTWRNGTSATLPFAMHSAVMVEYVGGALLIGGQLENGTFLDTIYFLPNAEATWELLPVKLSAGRAGPNAFLVPDEYCLPLPNLT